jgi:hypothetical protein
VRRAHAATERCRQGEGSLFFSVDLNGTVGLHRNAILRDSNSISAKLLRAGAFGPPLSLSKTKNVTIVSVSRCDYNNDFFKKNIKTHLHLGSYIHLQILLF